MVQWIVIGERETKRLQGNSDKKSILQQQDGAVIEQLDKDEDIDSDVMNSSEFGESIFGGSYSMVCLLGQLLSSSS